MNLINGQGEDVGTMLSPKQLAKRWGVSVSFLQRLRRDGCGPRFRKMGDLVRYPLAAVLEYETSDGAA